MLTSSRSKSASTSSTTLYSRLFVIVLWGLVAAASIWVIFGLFGLCWPEEHPHGPVLRSTGLVDSATSIAALHLLAELSKRNPNDPSPGQVVAAQRLLALLDSPSAGGNGNSRSQGPARSLGSMTASVRELAATIVDSADSPGRFKGSGENLDSSVSSSSSSTSSPQDEERDFEELYKDRLFTQQLCYIQTDESEVCTFENLMCFDGTSPIVTVETPIREPERILDYTHACMDYRYYEPTALEFSGCSYVNAGRRDYPADAPKSPSTDFPIPFKRRRWGPVNRNGGLTFKELTPREIWGDQPELVLEAFGVLNAKKVADVARAPGIQGGGLGADAPDLPLDLTYATNVLNNKNFELPGLDGLNVRLRTQVGNRTINWIDGPVWIAGLDGQWNSNPYHWWSKIGALYDAQRSNKTTPEQGFGSHPSDGYFQWQASHEIAAKSSIFRGPTTRNRAAYRVGAQWDLPGMDYIFFAGDGALEIPTFGDLKDWYGSVLRLATQPQSKYYFSNLLSRLDDSHIVCMPKLTAIPSVKNKWFTGRSDAWMLRQYAYQAAGVAAKGIRSHPLYPPRKIAIIDRQNANGRGMYNRDAVIDAVKATGVPYEVIPSMHALSFNQQVALMSRTGIVIAPHGAALANAMFLPAHGVVIELFPHLMKKNTYRHLASMMDLHYFPLYSWELLDPEVPANRKFYGVELMQEHYYWEHCTATNISSYDALNVHACNAASKNYPTVVPLQQFKDILRDAIDSIGAFSLLNPEWKAIAETEGVKVTPAPRVSKEDEHGING